LIQNSTDKHTDRQTDTDRQTNPIKDPGLLTLWVGRIRCLSGL
jgi:hypothetical protein